MALEKCEARNPERFGRQASVPRKIILYLARPAAFPAGERDVWVEGATLGLEADRLAHALDFCGQSGDGFFGLDSGP